MIEHIILFGISTLFWSNLFYAYKENYKTKSNKEYKLLRNTFSSTHAHGSIINCSLLLMFNCKLFPLFWSYGYFSYDLYLGLKKLIYKDIKYNKTLTYGYIIHHFIAILGLHYIIYEKYSNILNTTLLIAEVSNIPSYYIYNHIYNNNENSYECKKIKLIQLILYPFIRIFIIGYIIYKKYNIIPNILYPGIIIIYSMGLIWSYKLFNKYYN
jgi:hypothetical protein